MRAAGMDEGLPTDPAATCQRFLMTFLR
jgi:hypothetical protein